MGVIFAVIYNARWLFESVLSPFLRKATLFFSAWFLAIFLFLTASQTNLWGKPIEQIIFWAQQHPRSLAAQSQAVAYFQGIGEYKEADKYIQHLLKIFPDNSTPYLYLILSSCIDEQIILPKMSPIIEHFRTSKYDDITANPLIYIP